MTARARALDRYAWAAGIAFALAFVTEAAISVGVPINQNDSAAKIANALDDHHRRILVVACLSIVYAVAFLVYLTRLHDLLRPNRGQPRFLGTLVLTGGVLFVTLHAVSDIGIYLALAGKLASYSAQHDPGLAYTLYLLTFALDSVGDVFGSLFALAAGLLIFGSGVLPRWLGWLLVAVAPFFFLQGFGLGGVVAFFGLVLDLIGFLLFLAFVLASSVILLRRERAPQT